MYKGEDCCPGFSWAMLPDHFAECSAIRRSASRCNGHEIHCARSIEIDFRPARAKRRHP